MADVTRAGAILRTAADVQAERAAIHVGEPADRETMREHMPTVQAWMREAWATFGGLGAVVGTENDLTYRWKR